MGQRKLNRRWCSVARGENAARGSCTRPRRGLSLVEVIVALCLLGSVMLGLGMFTAKMSQSTSGARMTILASQLASMRLDSVKTSPRYSAIDTLFVATETGVKDPAPVNPNPALFTRQTWVTRVGGKSTDTTDYKLITVQVTSTSMTGSVRKSTAIAFY